MGLTCGVCTLINESNSATACSICNTPRRGGGSSVSGKVKTGASSTTTSSHGREKPGVVKSSKQLTLFGQVVDGKASKEKKSSVKMAPQSTRPIPTSRSSAPTDGNMKEMATKMSSKAPEFSQFSISYDKLAERAHVVLRDVFGFKKLRGLQPNAVECALRRQSQIIVMATGGGKSLCYQLPALTLGGTTLVISPLKALIVDQVEALVKKGVSAAFLSSQLTESAKTDVLECVLQRSLRSRSKPKDSASWKGKYINLLYCTPEMVQTERFRSILLELHKNKRLTGFAVDEAHCVSGWGHDFRPAYLKLNYLRETFPELPLMACTATATSQVLSDIRKFLHLADRPCHLGSFDRKNVFYKVRYRDLLEETPAGATGDMVNFIAKQHESAKKNRAKCNGIVYVHKQKDTDILAQIISQQTGIRAVGYHGGMKDADRLRIQEAWTSGEAPIAVGTVALGMGIDLPHVRYVIHWNMAKTIEGFYQESGRAGRDGLPAYSLLYFAKKDVSMFEYLARMKKSKHKDANITALDALEKMSEYCTKPACRRQYLLNFFGESNSDPRSVCMKSCDYCQNPEKVTKTIEAASCVNDFSFQTKAEKEWDGQWAAPHGDDDEGLDDDGIDRSWLLQSNGLSLTGEDVDNVLPNATYHGIGQKAAVKMGFSKASDVLAKYEAREQLDAKKQSKPQRKETSPIIPDHLRNALENAVASNPRIAKKETARSSADLEAEAARLKAELEKMKALRESHTLSGDPGKKRDGPPPPPALIFSTKKRRL